MIDENRNSSLVTRDSWTKAENGSRKTEIRNKLVLSTFILSAVEVVEGYELPKHEIRNEPRIPSTKFTLSLPK